MRITSLYDVTRKATTVHYKTVTACLNLCKHDTTEERIQRERRAGLLNE